MQVTVSNANRTVQVRLNNHTELNPTAARAAREIAFGVGANATVSDGSKAYRVTRSGTRKIR